MFCEPAILESFITNVRIASNCFIYRPCGSVADAGLPSYVTIPDDIMEDS